MLKSILKDYDEGYKMNAFIARYSQAFSAKINTYNPKETKIETKKLAEKVE
jgi:hypothetical protein